MANTIDVVELLERLRDADRNSVQRTNGSAIFGEAADTIERLRAELARISAINEDNHNKLSSWVNGAGPKIEALKAELAAKVPEGYVVVPVEPTARMCVAGANERDNGDGELHRRKWRAMNAAAEGGE